jgi:glyoxylase-like metal-dependent hydrolase (beta-lactamase superfamily II)
LGVPVGLPLVRDLQVRYGEVDAVSPLVRRVVANNPSPFTYLGTGTYLIGRGNVAVLDPGPDDPAHVEAVLAALQPGERVTHLIVTHTHSDHSPASRRLQELTEAPTYGFGPQGPGDDHDDPVVFGDPEADGDPSRAEPREAADRRFRPDLVLRDADIVDGDGWSLEAVHTPGHASNHLCYLLREEGVLCSGDHVMGWSTSVIPPPDGDLGAYMASLEKLLRRPQDRRYLPTHGPMITEPHALVAAFLAHRRERSDQILEALAAGPATIAELVPTLYADVSKRLWRGAASSMYAHLLHLHELGIVEVEDGGSLRRTSRFRCRT